MNIYDYVNRKEYTKHVFYIWKSLLLTIKYCNDSKLKLFINCIINWIQVLS